MLKKKIFFQDFLDHLPMVTNGLLLYSNKKYRVRLGRILYGMEIQGNEDHGQGGSSYGGYGGKVFYTRQLFQSTFSIEVLFPTFEERENFANWAIAYTKSISNWKNVNSANYMRVMGPRGFDFLGVLTEGIRRSNQVTDLVWTMDLVFRGSQPTRNGQRAFVKSSSFSPPNPNGPDFDTQSIYFYPSDMPLNSIIGAKEDSIYKTPTPKKVVTPGSITIGEPPGFIPPNLPGTFPTSV